MSSQIILPLSTYTTSEAPNSARQVLQNNLPLIQQNGTDHRAKLPRTPSISSVGKRAIKSDGHEYNGRNMDPCVAIPPRIEVGLQNLGNTCFMNSSLQCLLHIQPLVSYFMNDIYSYDINESSPMKGSLAKSFAQLVRDICSTSIGSSISPSGFQKVVGAHAPHLLDYSQQDCQEFLRFLLDGLSDDLSRKRELRPLSSSNTKIEQSINKPSLSNNNKEEELIDIVSNLKIQRSMSSGVKNGQGSVRLNSDNQPQISSPLSPSSTFVEMSCSTLPDLMESFDSVDPINSSTSSSPIACNITHSKLSNRLRSSISSSRMTSGGSSCNSSIGSMVTEDGIFSVVGNIDINKAIQTASNIVSKEGVNDQEGAVMTNIDSVTRSTSEDPKRIPNGSINRSNSKSKIYSKLKIPENPGPSIGTINALPSIGIPLTANLKSIKASGRSGASLSSLAVSPESIEEQEEAGDRREVSRPTVRMDPVALQKKALEEGRKAWEKYQRKNDSVITDLFAGQLQSTLECQICQHRSWCFDPFLDLSVPIPKGDSATAAAPTLGRRAATWSRRVSSADSKCTLDECLEKFSDEELLEGDNMVECENCKKKTKSIKRLFLFRYPKVLVIHIKRFRYTTHFREKLSTDVSFPLTGLDLSKYVSPDCRPTSSDSGLNISPPIYDLIGVSHHSGTMQGGHYIAHVNTSGLAGEASRWMCFNDAKVSSVNTSNLAGPSAYVLFYRLSETDSLSTTSSKI